MANFPFQNKDLEDLLAPAQREEYVSQDGDLGAPAQPAPVAPGPITAPQAPVAPANPDSPQAPNTGGEVPLTDPGAELLKQYKDLMAQRKTELAEAQKKQSRANMIAGIGEALAGAVGGATAMRTGASVRVDPAKIETPDHVGIVEKLHKPELDSLLQQYKALNDNMFKARRLENSEAWLDFNKKKGTKQLENTDENQSLAEERLNLQKEEALNKKVDEVSKRVEKSGLGSIKTSIDQIENQLGMSLEEALEQGKDLPGYGRAGSLVPNMFAGESARGLRQEVQNLLNAKISKDYGASQSFGEVARFNKAVGSGKLEDDKAIIRGLLGFKRAYETDVQNIKAGVGGKAFEEYENRGGITKKDAKPKENKKTVAKKFYSKSQNKTKIVYSDGSEEIVDGQQ